LKILNDDFEIRKCNEQAESEYCGKKKKFTSIKTESQFIFIAK
jgi:hypothetical protein